jgi:predicted ester cyclase
MEYVKGTPVDLQDWVTDALDVFPSETAELNAGVLAEHLRAEWNDDLKATMATMHQEHAHQRIPALGIAVEGFEAVREYYRARFESWPGPAFFMTQVAITETYAAIRGDIRIEPSGQFAGVDAAGKSIDVPAIVWIAFADGKLAGETIHLDGRLLQSQLAA